MTDLAVLGLAVDSSQVRKATSDLDQFAKAGKQAEQASSKVGDGLSKASKPAQEFARHFSVADGQQKSYSKSANRVVDSLANQFARLHSTGREWAQLNAVQKAGVDIGSEAADSIAGMAGAIYDLQQRRRQDAQAERERAKAEKLRRSSEVQAEREIQRLLGNYAKAERARQNAIKGTASAAGLARHELINLSRQVQDVFVSLGSGQGLGIVALQQGTQIADVFASSKATMGDFFRQAKSWFGGFLTAGRVAFGGVTAAVGVGATALLSYRNAQSEVERSLLGVGRASGVTADRIERIARSSSSAFGLSTREASEFASGIASVGRVSEEVIDRATRLGHDLSIVLGTDAKGAAEALSKVLADPARNLDALNSRLGAFSAASKAQIEDLVAQNRLGEAQILIIGKIEGATKGASDVTTGWSKAWTGLANVASNVWKALGRGIDGALGLNEPIEERYEAAQKRLKELQDSQRSDREYAAYLASIGQTADQIEKMVPSLRVMDDAVSRARQKVEDLKRQMEGAASASGQIARNMESVANRSLVSTFLPEIDQRRDLANSLSRAQRLAGDPAAQAAAGITQAEADRQLRIVDDLNTNFRTRSEQLLDQLRLAGEQVTALSPVARAVMARKQMLDTLKSVPGDPADKEAAAQIAYATALKQATVALSEQSRLRVLSASQAVESQQLEVDLVGKSIGQQIEMRENLRAYQQLKQIAAQTHTAFNQAEYEQLKKINAELAKRAQLLQVRQLQSDIAFERSQIGLSSSEQDANSRLRAIYGDDLNNAQAQFLKQQLMLNDAMREYDSITKDAAKGFIKDILNGKSAVESLAGALNKVADKLIDMALNNLWGNAFGGGGGGFNIMSLFGIGSGSGGSAVGNPGILGSLYHSGGIAGVTPTAQRLIHPAYFDDAPRYHAGGIAGLKPDEVPAILRKGEPVFQSMAHARAAMGGGVNIDASDNRVITINGGDQQAVAQIKAELARDMAERKAQIISVVREALRSRMLQ